MIINKKEIYFLSHNEFRPLSDCNIGGLYNFSDKDYYAIQFLEGVNCTTRRLDTAIPEHIRERIRKGELTLVLANQLEAFLTTADTVYEKFVVELNLPESNIVLLTGSPNIMPSIHAAANKHNKKPIKVIWCRVFEFTSAAVEFKLCVENFKLAPPDHTNQVFDKKFIYLNRRWRPHRPALVGLLACKNLLDQGYISLAPCEGSSWENSYPWIMNLHHDDNEFVELFSKNKDKLFNLPHMYVDTDTQEHNIPEFRNTLIPFYKNTYFSVASETSFYTSKDFVNSVFLSEKTYKEVTQRQPFVLVGTPHTLKAFRDIGYRSFSPFIDESYDDELNDSKRMMKIANEIERLCNLQGSELKDFIEGCKEICEHNYQNLLRDIDVLGRYCTDLN
jgi:hypothetical protein